VEKNREDQVNFFSISVRFNIRINKNKVETSIQHNTAYLSNDRALYTQSISGGRRMTAKQREREKKSWN
jgi:hypothetical protein